jgi:hypothetical protein
LSSDQSCYRCTVAMKGYHTHWRPEHTQSRCRPRNTHRGKNCKRNTTKQIATTHTTRFNIFQKFLRKFYTLKFNRYQFALNKNSEVQPTRSIWYYNTESPHVPDDGPLWPNQALNIHENMNYVANQPIICEAAMKTVVCMYVMWHLCLLPGNGSVNTFPKNTLSTIEGHPLLGNGPINTHYRQQ